MSSLSYVTGGHNMKIGLHVRHRLPHDRDADEQRRTAAAVSSRECPTRSCCRRVPSVQDTSIDREISIYIQDSWTLGRADLQPGPAVRAHQGIGAGSDRTRRTIPAGAGLHAGRLRGRAKLLRLQPAVRRRLRSLRERKDGAEGQLRQVRAVVLVEPRRRLQPDGRRHRHAHVERSERRRHRAGERARRRRRT